MKSISILFIALFAYQLCAQDTLVVGGPDNRIRDAWIWSYTPAVDRNFGVYDAAVPNMHQVIRAEVWQWEMGRDDSIRGLLQFDLADLKAQQVLRAELNLWHYSNPGFTKQVGANALDMHLITESWAEDKVTWNNQPAFDSEALVSLPRSSSNTQDYVQLDVTDLIKAYLTEDAHGLMLKLNDEKHFAGLSFASSEHTDASLRPTLRIIVDRESGVETAGNAPLGVFPNPCQNLLHISVNPAQFERLALLDMQGNRVMEVSTTSAQIQLAVGDLPSGMYMLRAEGNMVQRMRLVLVQ